MDAAQPTGGRHRRPDPDDPQDTTVPADTAAEIDQITHGPVFRRWPTQDELTEQEGGQS